MAWSDLKNKAKLAAASLKAEYEAGKSGDETPAAPLWPSPKQQLDAFVSMLKSFRPGAAGAGADGPAGESTTAQAEANATGTDMGTDTEAAAGDVADALRRVDWAGVRAATAAKTGEATRAMRSMAEQVDWERVQPMAAQVSRALIAAVASGQIPLGGAIGPTVVRTIAGQNGLSERVAQHLQEQRVDLPPDYRNAIGTTATEL